MIVVLVNQQTKEPTGFEPNEDTARFFTGPYQNVARVTEEWLAAERKYLNRIAAAIAAERERCAQVANDMAREVDGATSESRNLLDRQEGLTYSVGYAIALDRLAECIRSGE